MARWKLTEAHYLMVEGTKWEYSEVDRITGRPKRTQFPVPLYVNPNYEDDLKGYGQPDEVDGLQIIVSNGNNAKGKDLIFTGPPTPGMLPLDDEAKELSAKLNIKPTQGLDPESQNMSFSNQLMSGLIDQMTDIKAGIATAPAVPGMAEFMQTMGAMMKQQTEILASLSKVVAEGKRRVA